MGSILVTGAAGFIGTNFVRYWVEQHPGDHVVALDALTYAGVRENVEGIEGVTFVQADIGATEVVEQVLEEHASIASSTSPPNRTTAWRSSTPPGSSAPTCWAPRGSARRPVGSASRASITSRRARSTATSRSRPTRGSTRSPPTGRARRTTRPRPAATTSCVPTTRRGTCRSRSRTAPTTTGRSSSRRRSSRTSRRWRCRTFRCRCTPRPRTDVSGSTPSTIAGRST